MTIKITRLSQLSAISLTFVFAFFLISGTHNNQYMVLDLKLVTLKEINDSAFWLVEQIPGCVDIYEILISLYFKRLTQFSCFSVLNLCK